MRVGSLADRLTLFVDEGALDVERASGGRFAADPQAVYDRWDEFVDWARAAPVATATPFDRGELRSPVPRPAQIFAIGLNYRDHAAESNIPVPDAPSVFTKFRSAITGPYGEIDLPPGTVDWEVELVVVIGRQARRVPVEQAWQHVAGLTVGQDVSERTGQLAGAAPQFSLAKSYPGFAPIGPWVVTVDELDDPDDLELGCSVNGESMQKGRTSDLVYPVPALVAELSAVLTLWPGDIIFTGTPAGVGQGRTPQRFLAPGDELVSFVTGIGDMRHRFVRAA